EARKIANLEDGRRAVHVESKANRERLAVGQLHRVPACADDPFEGITGAGGSPAFCFFEEMEHGPQPIVFRERNLRTAEFHGSLRAVRTAALPGDLPRCSRASG